MSFRLLNRVRVSLTGAAGTGPVTVNTQTLGFQNFVSAGLQDGDTTPYVIEDGTPVGSTWEIGVGTWHSSGQFTRDTISQSSLGGSTPLSVSATAILSATFRAQDLSGEASIAGLADVNLVSVTGGQLLRYNGTTGFWENVSLNNGQSQPQVVQFRTIQLPGVTGPANVTFVNPLGVGNVLVAMSQGGGSTVGGVYTSGFAPNIAGAGDTLFDRVVKATDRYTPSYAMRRVRSGDPTGPWTLGSATNSGPPFTGVLVEVSGVDITRCSDLLMSTAVISTLQDVNVLSAANSLVLAFGGGDPQTVTVNHPTQLANFNNGTSSVIFAAENTVVGWDHFNGSIAGGASLGVRVMSLAGV